MENNELKITVPTTDICKKVPASELSLNDDFIKNYIPKNFSEERFFEEVKRVIKDGVQDFYHPTLDPSFDVNGEICYQAGMMPAVGKSYNWWNEHAKMYCSERNSRLGTYSEYIAFLAVLIKEMVASGKFSLEEAWSSVHTDSKKLGHYLNSSDAKKKYETTGNREVCGWSDLANTFKILSDDDNTFRTFWLASGDCIEDSYEYPLAGIHYESDSDHGYFGVGWLVLS